LAAGHQVHGPGPVDLTRPSRTSESRRRHDVVATARIDPSAGVTHAVHSAAIADDPQSRPTIPEGRPGRRQPSRGLKKGESRAPGHQAERRSGRQAVQRRGRRARPAFCPSDRRPRDRRVRRRAACPRRMRSIDNATRAKLRHAEVMLGGEPAACPIANWWRLQMTRGCPGDTGLRGCFGRSDHTEASNDDLVSERNLPVHQM
jgi:hypothetical protein